MRHDLEAEIGRIHARPWAEPIALLALVKVTPIGTRAQYSQRLRAVLQATLDLVVEADFDADGIEVHGMPDWFVELTNGHEGLTDMDPLGSHGKELYLDNRSEPPWDLEEWFYCFDPELRGWEWWDVTNGTDGAVHVWLDTKGEVHIPCEELWWLLYLSGASSAASLTLENASAWERETSII